MATDWDQSDLWQVWTLAQVEIDWIMRKPARLRLGYAVQLKFYAWRGRFVENPRDVPDEAIEFVAQQIGANTADFLAVDWPKRTGRRHREDIRGYLGVRKMTPSDVAELSSWLEGKVCPVGEGLPAMTVQIYAWCRDRALKSPTADKVDRLARAARHRFEDAFFLRLFGALSQDATTAMQTSLDLPDEVQGFHGLKADSGAVSLENLLNAAERLNAIRGLKLPHDAIATVGGAFRERIHRRVSQEAAWEMNRHPKVRKMGLYAVFLAGREQTITDQLVDLLIETIHKMTTKAERRVVTRFSKEVMKVQGKERLLYLIAEASVEAPDKTVREVVFPIVNPEKLAAVIQEYTSAGAFHAQVHKVLRSSYGNHYRRMLPKLLESLEFRSNNAAHQPVLDALAWLKTILAAPNPRRVIKETDEIPVDEILPPKWRDLIKEVDEDGGWRMNRIDYELYVLRALRDRLRSKEIWVVGADRYRNPDLDLPQDFEARRADYYRELGQTEDASAFVDRLRKELRDALDRLNKAMPTNPHVRLTAKGRHPLSLSPLTPVSPPPNLEALKSELERRWSGTGLLDIQKEAALQTGLLDAFETSGDRVVLVPDVLQRRLLLCLYGLGTNAGLKRVCNGQTDVTYAELLHVRRRFLHKESLKRAISTVTNAILAVREPTIWGESTASCASDSKKFGAWDQNLMTEWHARYGGRGVMIYWHVERRAACIHSQLKRCSSSEAAAMIEGVLRHCTDAEIQHQYVDSHGQSEVAFAFCRLLGFILAPRLKAIARQKLYLPDLDCKSELAHLEPILTRAINWDLIERQYDEMIKFTAALRHKTAEPEAILRRFAASSVRHPTYSALAELGKVIKTIFLCRYLDEEAFRREINAGLNIVENWNSANGFIFFGKGGEISTNRLEDQELSVLALHLLQNSLVYINTLMLQKILSEPAWVKRMTSEDWRGLTPLIYPHINPYGQFTINLEERIDFDQKLAA